MMKRTHYFSMAAVVMIVLAPATGRSQARPAFEVASIKPHPPDAGGRVTVGIMPQPGGRLTVTGANLRALIRFAYNIDNAQISGGPTWMDSDQYDIVAKGDGNATTDQLREMLQTLLADRFQLRVHHASKELPVYVLGVTKGGAKLKPSTQDTVTGPSFPPRGGGSTLGGRGEGARSARGVFMGGGTAQINGPMTMPELSQLLANLVGRKVIDKTGLDGRYDVKLEWTPQPGDMQGTRGFPAGPGPEGRGGDTGTPADPSLNGVSIFTALQEQLGLYLASGKGPVDIIVIDNAAKAAGN